MYRLGLREKRRFRVCRTRNLGRMQTGLKKPRLYIHHLFGLMQFTVQYCFHVICMYVPKCRDGRHRQISGRFPMSHVDLGHRSHVETSAHVDLGTIGSGLRTTWAKTPGDGTVYRYLYSTGVIYYTRGPFAGTGRVMEASEQVSRQPRVMGRGLGFEAGPNRGRLR